MKEQQVSELIAALQAETMAKQAQTAAINRLAESNESLVAILADSLAELPLEADLTPPETYLSGKPRG